VKVKKWAWVFALSNVIKITTHKPIKMKTSYTISAIQTNKMVTDSFLERELNLSFSVFKNPKNSVIVLLSVVLFVELLIWGIAPLEKTASVTRQLGVWYYFLNFLVGFIAPEFCTLLILSFLIRKYHTLLGLTKIQLNIRSILHYELSFLPLLMVAFFIFFPVTLHIRFILRKSIGTTSLDYIDFMRGGFHWQTYLLYLPFVLILGYLLVNISLFKDFLKVSQHALNNNTAPKTLSPVMIVPQKVLTEVGVEGAFTKEDKEKVGSAEYKRVITARDNIGDVVLKVEDCCYFEADGKYLKVHHNSGKTYRMMANMTTLMSMLDPAMFFRGNRSYLLNLNFVKSYCYWEKGKYTIYLNTPDNKEVVMPRVHLSGFKEALEALLLLQ
jgi:two-component system, LytTR family, response regulator